MSSSSNQNPAPKNILQSYTWYILIFAVLGLAFFFTPIQHYISIGRTQHHGIAIGIFGLGFWVETLLSRKRLSRWGKRAYLSAGLFFTSVGIVFYKNPWIYSNVSIDTEENLQFRGFLLFVYLIAVAIVTVIWIKYTTEDYKAMAKSLKDESNAKEENGVKEAKSEEGSES